MIPAMQYVTLLFPDFFLIVLGYVLCRWTPLNRSVWQSVEMLVYYLLFPVMLFTSIAQSTLDWAATSQLVLAGLLCAGGGVALAYSLPHWPLLGRRIDRREHAASAQIAFRFNSFIGLALAQRLGGVQGLLLMSVLIGFCVPLMNVAAVWPMARSGGHQLARQLLRNPLILATSSGLAANALGWHLPELLHAPASRIGAAAIAMGLMCAGAGMRLGLLGHAWRLSGGVLAIRHLLLPLIAFGTAWALHLSSEQALVLLLFNALPASSTCYVLAAQMGFNGGYVAMLVTLSTALAALSLPLAMALVQYL